MSKTGGVIKVMEIDNTKFKVYEKQIIHLRWVSVILFICVLSMICLVFHMNYSCNQLATENMNNIKQIEALTASRDQLLDENKNLLYINGECIRTVDSLKEANSYMGGQVLQMQYEVDEMKNYMEVNVVTPTTVTATTDLSVITIMDVDTMNKIIDRFAEKNYSIAFKGHGSAFIQASKQTGLDPVFLLSISCLESGWGNSRIAKEKNNYMGIGAYDMSPYTSSHNMGDDMDQGIINGAIWIKENYYDLGQRTLYDMIYGKKQYSSSTDHWISSITGLMNKSYKYAVE